MSRANKLVGGLFALAVIFAGRASEAQIPYGVTHSSGVWTPITGTSHTPVAYGAFPAWDEGYVALPLPFSVSWFGNVYDTVYVYTNGFLGFAPPTPGAGIFGPPTLVPNPASTIHDFIGVIWADLNDSPTASIQSLTNGAAPNRSFVVQMTGMQSVNTPAPGSNVSFQVWFHESDGRVELVYGPNHGIINATAAAQNDDGTDGFNFMGPSPTCGATCTCVPRSCSSLQWPEGKRITIELPLQAELHGAISAPPGAFPGSTFPVDVSIRNSGRTAAGPFSYRIDVSASRQINTAVATLGTFPLPGLAEATALEVSHTLTMPAGLGAGVYYLALVVDALDEVAEPIETNNLSFSQAMGTAPDLQGVMEVPAATGPSEPFPVGFTLRSQGAPVTGPVTVSFHFSLDTSWDPSDILVDTVQITMPDGFRSAQVLNLTSPANLQTNVAGYYLIARIDPQNEISELNESNNVLISALVGVTGADLEVTRLDAGPFAFRGQPYPVTAVIRNAGGATARGFSTCIVLSDNQLISVISDEIIAETAPLTLSPGEAMTLNLQPVIPPQLAPGAWYVAAVVDCRDAVAESQEGNNIRRRTDTIQVRDPAPNFVALEVLTTSTAAAGETIPISARFANLGNAPGEVSVRLVISGDQAISPSDPVVWESPAPITLSPPQEHTLSVWGRVPVDLPSGRYFVGLVIDPEGLVEEIQEDDNIAVSRQVMVAAADLAIVTPPPPNAVIGAPYTRRFAAVGGSGTFAFELTWASGRAPAGLTFHPELAELSGTPESAAEGIHRFTVRVTSGALWATRDYQLLVAPPTVPLTVASSRLPPGIAGERYRISLIAVGGHPPYRWANVGNVPLGLTVTEEGEILGEPVVVGGSNFTVAVTDIIGARVTGILSLDVVDPSQTVSISNPDLANAVVGLPYETLFVAAGGRAPLRWRLEGTVPGLDFDPSRAALTGTPTVAGSYPLLVEVRDADNLLDRNAYVLEVFEEGVLRITTGPSEPLPAGRRGEAYTGPEGADVYLRAVPAEGVRWMLVSGELPPGLELDLETGRIFGTPTAVGTWPFLVVAWNAANDTRRAALAIAVTEPQAGGNDPDDPGCGCTGAGAGSSRGAWALLALGGLLVLGRRRGRGGWALVALFAAGNAEAQTVPYQVIQEPEVYQPLGPSAVQISPGLGDGGTFSLGLPFPVYLYGTAYDRLFVNANGWLSVVTSGTGFHFPAGANPSTAPPNGFIAPLWDDWCASPTGCFGPLNPGMGTFYEIDATPGRGRVTVEFRRLTHFADIQSPSDVSFKVTVHEGPAGLIEMSYGTIRPGSATATLPTTFGARIGIENAAGNEGMWVGPCAGATPCSASVAASLTNTKITIVADAGEDVMATAVSVPEIAYPGLPFPASFRLASRHQNPIGPFRWEAYLVPGTATSTAAGRKVHDGAPVTLAGFENRAMSFDVEVPDDLLRGQYRLAIVVDSEDEIAETDEHNNVAFSHRSVRIADRAPDFRVVSVRPLATLVSPGQNLAVAYRLENFGNEPGRMDVQAYLSTNTAITTSDTPFGSELSFDMGPRQVVTGTITARIPADLRTGPRHVGLILDPHQRVAELDEANNVGRAANTVLIASFEVEIVQDDLPPATLGHAYSTTLVALGGDGRFAFRAEGRLPRGMVFAADRAELHGIPLELGRFPLHIEARSGSVTGEKDLELVVLDPDHPLAVLSGRLPAAVLGADYAAQLVAAGGAPPLAWRIQQGALPAGLVMAANGTIFGVPASPGSTSLVVEVRDNRSQTATAAVSLEIRSPGNLTVTSFELPQARLGQPYDHPLAANGGVGTLTWRARSLAPPGLAVAPGGRVDGTPERVGQYRFIVEVQDERGNVDTALVNLVVASSGVFGIRTESLPVGEPETEYLAAIRAEGGDGPYTWELVRGEGGLPAGFQVRTSEGEGEGERAGDLIVNGYLDEEGLWAFTVRVFDARGRSDERAFALLSRAPAITPEPVDEGCACSTLGRGVAGGLDAWSVLAIVGLLSGLAVSRRRGGRRGAW